MLLHKTQCIPTSPLLAQIKLVLGFLSYNHISKGQCDSSNKTKGIRHNTILTIVLGVILLDDLFFELIPLIVIRYCPT